MIKVTVNIFDMLIASLAAWRIAYMLKYEGGPWDVFIRIRDWFGNSVLGKAMDCIPCSSIWLAAALFLIPGIDYLVIVLAISSMVIIVEAIHGMLRNEIARRQGPTHGDGDGGVYRV